MASEGLLDNLLQPGQTKSQLVDELIAGKPLQKLFDAPHPRDSVNQHLLKSFGSPAIAAGIAGNIDVETGGTFDYKQKQVGGGNGVGLFQMEYPPMKEAYQKFLGKNKMQDSAESQIDFVKSAMESGKDYEIGGKARENLRKAFATEDPTIISAAFMNNFENPGKPHPERRFQSSQEHFKEFLQIK